MCSVSGGVVSIWAHNQVENWSAFAPDFKELDENVEYEEKEGEFDLEDEDTSVQENKGTVYICLCCWWVLKQQSGILQADCFAKPLLSFCQMNQLCQ